MAIGPCRIVLYKASTPIREHFIQQLEAWPEVELIATHSTLKGVIASIAAHPIDLLIADRDLPDGDGLEAIRRLRKLQPRADAMVIAKSCDAHSVLKAIEVGAAGYLHKNADRKELLATIADLLAGRPRISASLARAILQQLSDNQTNDLPSLTGQEAAILNAIAQEAALSEVADQFNLPKKHLPLHIRNIYRKLTKRSLAVNCEMSDQEERSRRAITALTSITPRITETDGTVSALPHRHRTVPKS